MHSISFYKSRSATENVQEAINIARKNEIYHSLLYITETRALERASKVDSGEITGRLAGVPFVVKDNFLTFDGPTTAGSKFLENFISPIQATAVDKLEAEGAICIGKANLDAFAHGGSTENSAFGPTLNALDKTKVAGGSSGGSAVSVALGIVPFALGSDTGGSIRQPASFNGVIGLKPTYGRISRYGVVAMASSTDSIGFFTNNIDDCELLMEILSGRDDNDMTTLPEKYERSSNASKKLRIGFVKQFMDEGVDKEVIDATMLAIEKLKQLGHEIDEVDMPILKHTLAMYYIIVPAEVSSNLARYDGIRYGRRSEDSQTLAEVYGKSRDEGFETENKRRIMIGSYVLSSGYFDAYYLKAQKARTLLINDFNKTFEKFDLLVGPVTPTPAFGLGENTSDPIKMYLADIMTVPASLAGLPAISIPNGNSESGLPIGLQIIGPRGRDSDILALSEQLEAK